MQKLAAAKPPWELKHWSPEQQQAIYRDWGMFFANKNNYRFAKSYFEQALALRETAWGRYLLSQAQRALADAESAELNAIRAAKLNPDNIDIRLEICDNLYESNRLLETKLHLHSYMRLFKSKGRKPLFLNRLSAVDGNLHDSLGESMTPFILKYSDVFQKVMDDLNERRTIETRPRWKIMRDLQKCDVVSILEKEIVLISPIERARRHRAFRVFTQIYLNRSCLDVMLLASLRHDKNLLLSYAPHSTEKMGLLVNQSYQTIWKFLKMLQTRSPLYHERYEKSKNPKLREEMKNQSLNRIQYQTRRNMITILRSVHLLRNEGDYELLVRYVEEVMGDYVCLKSTRVMPWILEFLYEVYYVVALTIADGYKRREFHTNNKNQLLTMLSAREEVETQRRMTFVFGEQTAMLQQAEQNRKAARYKIFLARMDKRLKFSRLAIERCYLYYEIARAHLEQSKADECYFTARKLISEAQGCNSNLWEFLGIMMKTKVHASFFKRDRVQKNLYEARVVAEQLRDWKLISFIDSCLNINEEAISLKKKNQSMDSMRRKARYSSQARMQTYNDVT